MKSSELFANVVLSGLRVVEILAVLPSGVAWPFAWTENSLTSSLHLFTSWEMGQEAALSHTFEMYMYFLFCTLVLVGGHWFEMKNGL